VERQCERGKGEDWHLISHIRDIRIGYWWLDWLGNLFFNVSCRVAQGMCILTFWYVYPNSKLDFLFLYYGGQIILFSREYICFTRFRTSFWVVHVQIWKHHTTKLPIEMCKTIKRNYCVASSIFHFE
jgi:hypothetical protein